MSFDPRQTNPVGIVLLFAMILGVIVAFALGRMVALGDFAKIGMIGGAILAGTICLAMGKKIWMLIPLCWLLTGKVSILPLPFNVRELGVFAAFAVYMALAVFKKLPKGSKSNKYDLLLYINLGYIFTVYLRNPVGASALGSELVGGRPYLDIAVSVMALWVMQHVNPTLKECRYIPILMSAGSIVVATLGVLTQRFTFLVPFIAPFYNGISTEGYLAEQIGTSLVAGSEAEYRIGSFQAYSGTVGSVLVSFFRPFSLFVFARPLWSLLFYSALLAGLLAGFRSGLVSLILLTLLSSYFYSGLKDVIRIGVIIVVGIALLMSVQSFGFSLPPAIQRSFSFIPGPWDQDVVRAADASSEWRFEMWKIALEGDKYIKNKLLGDGYGFTASDLAIQRDAAWGGKGYLNAGQTEAQLITGQFHSGPISAIRYVGLVGLVLYTIFMLACAKYAWDIVWRSKGTPFFPMGVYVGSGAIISPFFYWFVFGGFDGNFPGSIFTLAMLNLTSRSISSWEQNRNEAKQIQMEPEYPLAPAIASSP